MIAVCPHCAANVDTGNYPAGTLLACPTCSRQFTVSYQSHPAVPTGIHVPDRADDLPTFEPIQSPSATRMRFSYRKQHRQDYRGLDPTWAFRNGPAGFIACVAVAAVAFAVLFFFWNFQAIDPALTSTPNQRVVTRANYDSIQPGMSYEEAVHIIGSPGTELSRSEIDGVPGIMDDIHTAMYMWRNHDGSNMNAIFQNGELKVKSQFGLR